MTLTTRGLERVETDAPSTSNEVFIAMWFDDRTANVRKVVKAAVEDAGYEPVIVDEQQYNGQIVDQIVRRIGTARAMVADLSGQRPSVYYEIGRAHEAGKETILTVPSDEADNVGFDIAQANQIRYGKEDLEDSEAKTKLKKRITERLIATAGQGPGKR